MRMRRVYIELKAQGQMIGPDGLFEEWLKPGPYAVPGPESVMGARMLLLFMLGGAAVTILLLRWYVRTARRRDFEAHRRMQWVLMAAMWATFVAGMGAYFWYLYSLAAP